MLILEREKYRISYYETPYARFSDEECSKRLSKQMQLTPEEKKRAIEWNNKQRKRK